MTSVEWGAPLTGAEMKLLRAAGLPDNHWFEWKVGVRGAKFWKYENDGYHLLVNHIAYKVIEAGWLDKPNVRLWFGGDEAPSDWDGGRVLLGCGVDVPCPLNWRHNVPDDCIIAYIAKDEVMESDEPDTVTIAKMTEAEADDLFYMHDYEIVSAFKSLGLIKEPTREERFWALHEPEGATVPTHIKKLVKDALEFEQ